MREPNCLTIAERGHGERRAGQRRYAPKTRSGCITCKIRRVKCDEAKPRCKRCTSTGRQCDGYAPVPQSKSAAEETPLSLALTIGGSSDALEHRTFEFFKTKTTPCIAGYFPDSIWDKTLLQASQNEPSIRFAVNALGALHEERFLRKAATEGGVDTSLVQTNFPANQYAKALKGLQDLLSSPNPRLNVVLLCSLVCIHFESLRENFLPALIHVEHAIQLLDSADGTEKIDPSLVRALMRADLQGSVYVGMRVPKLSFYTNSKDSDLPEAGFSDLLHARDYIDAWSCRLYHFLRSKADNYKFRNPGNVPLEDYANAQELENRFIEIDRLLYELMQRPTLKLSPREHYGMGMLRARAKVNRILAGGCLYSEATVLDRFLDQFEEIYAICKYIMQSDRGYRRLFSVSFDEGLLHPLYFVVTNCRDSRLRHACMAMLKKLPSLEGIWHVEAMTRAAESCIKFEEATCKIKTPRCSDIPEWRRIHSAGFDGWSFPNSDTRTSVTAHFRVRPNGMDGDWMDVEQLIEWSDPPPAISIQTSPYEHRQSLRINEVVY